MRYSLAALLRQADEAGVWAFTHDTLSVLCGDIDRKYLHLMVRRACDNENRKLLTRAVPGLFVNHAARCLPYDVRAGLVPFLRPREVSYVSLESVLSESGAISQVTTALTLMTTGEGHAFRTPWGILDFTHTEREISPETGVDFARDGLPTAGIARAWEDLQAVRRNLDLVDRDLLQEIMEEQEDEQPGLKP